jgi:hypothetical protein
LCIASLLVVGAPVASAGAFSPGAPGAGDPFFPLAGNGGYDVRHYSLRIDFEPQNNAIDARAVISARATQDLSRFDLDLREDCTSPGGRSTAALPRSSGQVRSS